MWGTLANDYSNAKVQESTWTIASAPSPVKECGVSVWVTGGGSDGLWPLILSLSKDERGLMVRQAHHERFQKRGCNASAAAIGTAVWKVATYDFSYVLKPHAI